MSDRYRYDATGRHRRPAPGKAFCDRCGTLLKIESLNARGLCCSCVQQRPLLLFTGTSEVHQW